jgi:hypothetical protein
MVLTGASCREQGALFHIQAKASSRTLLQQSCNMTGFTRHVIRFVSI